MPNLVDSDCGLRDYFVDYRKAKTVNVIPYDSSLPQKPVSETPLGNHSSKKVTVVGMGQVGLGCVAAILNQDRCWFQAIYLLHILHVIYIYIIVSYTKLYHIISYISSRYFLYIFIYIYISSLYILYIFYISSIYLLYTVIQCVYIYMIIPHFPLWQCLVLVR